MIQYSSKTKAGVAIVIGIAIVGVAGASLHGAGQQSRAANAGSQPRLFTEAQATSGKAVYERHAGAGECGAL